MSYVVTDDYGFVVEYGNSNILPTGAIEVDGSPVLGMSYVVGSSMHTMPEQPSINHSIDKVGKCWKLDEILASNNVKNIRQELLKETDWTQMQDVSVATQNIWKDYRQALRDITVQVGFPFDIMWPVKPV